MNGKRTSTSRERPLNIRADSIWRNNNSNNAYDIYAPADKEYGSKSVWRNLFQKKQSDSPQHEPRKITGNPRDFDNRGERWLYDEPSDEKLGFSAPKFSPTSSKGPELDSSLGKYFSQSSIQMLNEFLSGHNTLDSHVLEQILLPPKTYNLYKNTEELRKLFEPHLERETYRISEDIDMFMDSLRGVFEEIKKLLCSKVMQAEFDFKESITLFTQSVERYLKETYMALVEDKRKGQYYSMGSPYGPEDGDNSVDGQLEHMQKQRRTVEMTENALKLIRNHRRSHKIPELTEMVDSFVRSDKGVYQRSQFRRLFAEFRDDVVKQIEDMDLLRDNNVVKKLNASLITATTDHRSSSGNSELLAQRQFTLDLDKRAHGRNPSNPIHNSQSFGKQLRPKHLPQVNERDSILNHSGSDGNETIYSIHTNERPLNQRISTNPLIRGSQFKVQEGLTVLNDSIGTSKQRRLMLEERERDFRQRTNDPMWQSRVLLSPSHAPVAPAEDNLSWKFLESIKRNIFGS